MKTVCIALVFVSFLAVGSSYHVYEWGEHSGCGNIVFEEVIKITGLPDRYRTTRLNYPTYVSIFIIEFLLL